MPTLQELERPIDEAIVDQLVQATPEWWKAAVLEVTRSVKANEVEGFAHLVTSPEGHRDVVQATDEIFELTLRLADLFKRFGKPWKKVVYSIRQNDAGGWSYSADFEY
jgi:hypothetical protein